MTDKPPAKPTESPSPEKSRETTAPTIDFASLANQRTPGYLSPGAHPPIPAWDPGLGLPLPPRTQDPGPKTFRRDILER